MARQTLTQRIALDGGKDIEKELASIGKAGEEAFKKLQEAANGVGKNSFAAKLSSGIASLRSAFTTIAAAGSELGAAFGNLNKSFDNVGRSATFVRNRLLLISGAALAAGASIIALAKASASSADQANKAAQGIGVSIGAFGRLRFAAEQSNLTQEDFIAGMSRLNKIIGAGGGLDQSTKDATKFFEKLGVTVHNAMLESENRIKAVAKAADVTADDVGNVADAFKQLGIKVRDFSAADPEKRIGILADAFKTLPDSAEKSAIAIQLFGRQLGPQFLAFLNEGSKAIHQAGADFDRLHGELTTKSADIGNALTSAFGRLGAATSGLRDRIGEVLAPGLTRGADALANIIAKNREAIAGFVDDLVKRAIPIIEDFIAAFSGRRADVKNLWVLQWRDSIVEFGTTVRDVVLHFVIPTFLKIVGAVDFVTQAINKLFGQHFSTGGVAAVAIILQLVGVFGFLAAVLGTVAAAIAVVGALFSPAGLLFLAIIALPFAILGIKAAIEDLFTFVVAGGTELWKELTALWAAGGAALSAAWQFITAGATAVWQEITAGATALWGGVTALWTAAIGEIESLWNGLTSFIESSISTVLGWIQNVITAIQNAVAAAASLVGLSGGGGFRGTSSSFAGGGKVRGPGTSTSDSILARLSAGEFVIKTKAVQHYGPQLMAAINSMRLPKDWFRGFSLGGLADDFSRSLSSFAVPRFADGGMALAGAGPSGRHIDLHIGNEVFRGLVAPEPVAKALETYAATKRMVSAGRKPRSYGA